MTTKRHRKTPSKALDKLLALGISSTQIKKNKPARLPSLSKGSAPKIESEILKKKNPDIFDLLYNNKDPDGVLCCSSNGEPYLKLPSFWVRLYRWFKKLFKFPKY